MTTEKQEKIQKLLDELKQEIFVELDRRVRTAQKEFAGQMGKMETKVGEKVEETVQETVQQTVVQELKPWRKQVYKKFQEELRDFQNKFSYYKFPYAATVIVGFMLFWYGMWNLLARIPFFGNAVVPLGLGLALLLISGAAYKKLVG